MDLESSFQEAVEIVRDFVNVDTQTMLRLYALYKQATLGSCNVPKPGIFSFTARKKWEAWDSLGTASSSVAMSEYVELVNSLASSNGDKSENKTKSTSTLGVSVSCMAKTEEDLEDGDKTIFDWLKEGNSEKVSSLLAANPALINRQDESDMALIHWAADRGDAAMIQLLADQGANLNALDDSGQTALHYAFSCGHKVCIQLLEELGADRNIRDSDGNLPNEMLDL